MARCSSVGDILRYKEFDIQSLFDNIRVALTRMDISEELKEDMEGLEQQYMGLLAFRRRRIKNFEKSPVVGDCAHTSISKFFSSSGDSFCLSLTSLSTIGKEEISVLIERAKLAKQRDTKAVRLQGNYEFDKKNPGEPLKRKTFHLALKEIDMTSIVTKKLYNIRKGFKEGKKVDATPSGVQDSRPPKSATYLLPKKKASSGSTKKHFFEESKIEVQQVIEFYVVGATSLEGEFADCLVGAKSLSSFLIEGYRAMNKIKKLLIMGKPHILDTGNLVNQLLLYKNIEKELVKEKDDLFHEKEILEMKLEKYKLKAGKAKEVAIHEAKKAWDMEKKEEVQQIKGDGSGARKVLDEVRAEADRVNIDSLKHAEDEALVALEAPEAPVVTILEGILPEQILDELTQDTVVGALVESILDQKENIDHELVASFCNGNTDSLKLLSKILPGNGGLSHPDATMHLVKSTNDVLNLMKLGEMNRFVSSTALNNRSSRSHSGD
ncbi:hypothetical protein GIB67_034932 [Kingdonia uniflora]|uniref:Uncharacterized protein n=1 Tax=Kingdonia uniflora TaxID=39325 RepID=A0A7J7NGK9_9MAGN|nr:hypothetical protein GIB67_034932 [Kingdonia uniflora]